MKLYLVIVAILALLSNAYCANIWPNKCGKLNLDSFYSTKNISDFDEFPWTARVGYEDKGEIKYHCSAVLINKRYLISVAHCYQNIRNIDVQHVILGDWKVKNNIDEQDCNSDNKCAPVPTKYEISEIVVHPDYNSRTMDNDLALLRLKDLVTFTDFISPICMPDSIVNNDYFSGQYLHVTGFELIRGDRDIAEHKVKTLVHIMDTNRCNEVLKNVRFSTSGKHICGVPYANYLLLSGAPLMNVYINNGVPQRYYLLGVVSIGPFRTGTQVPDIYVRISSFLDWINLNVIE